MLAAGIYARVSTDKQSDSLDAQVEIIKEFSKRMDYDVYFSDSRIYVDDAESGFKTTMLQRPSMKRLLDDINDNKIDVIFFKGISRFARDSGEAITTTNRLVNKGIRVISIEENFDSEKSGEDRTVFNIYAVLAESESRKTSIRVSLSNKQKALRGLWANSIPPYGYIKVKDIPDEELRMKLLEEKREPHSLYPLESRAMVVRKIFDMYLNGYGRKKITSILNDEGYRMTNGNYFQEKYIKNILSNPAYVGDIVYGKTRYNYVEDDAKEKKVQKTIAVDEGDWAVCKDAHEPIVERSVFKQVQDMISKREEMYKGKRFNNARHPLTGILKCGKCGQPMMCQKRTGRIRKDGTKTVYRYYVCSTYHKKGRNVCDQKNINADELEEHLQGFISRRLELIKNNQSVLDNYSTYDPNEEINKKVSEIEAREDKLIKEQRTLLRNQDIYDEDTFRTLNIEITKEKEKLIENKRNLLNNLVVKDNNFNTKNEVLEYIDMFLEMNINDIEEAREIFHQYIEEIILTGEHLDIKYRFKLLDVFN